MKALALAFLFAAPGALAAHPAYDLKLNLSMNGQQVASPRVLVGAGQKALITQDEKTYIEILADEGSIQDSKGILMKFVIGTIGKDGKRTVIAKPSILTAENTPAQVIISESEDGPEQMSLSVTAKRTTF